MPKSAASRKWDKENLAVLSCRAPKELAVRFRTACAGQGSSVNAILLAYVREFVKKHEARE